MIDEMIDAMIDVQDTKKVQFFFFFLMRVFFSTVTNSDLFAVREIFKKIRENETSLD